MKNYRLNPAAFRGTTVDLENWDKNSIIDIRLKTNVKGVFIDEYWHPYESSGCYLVFLEYRITKTTKKDRESHYSFCTLEEAKCFYKKCLKESNTKTVTLPKRGYMHSHLSWSSSWESTIMLYAEKRGVLKSGFDVEIVRTS